MENNDTFVIFITYPLFLLWGKHPQSLEGLSLVKTWSMFPLIEKEKVESNISWSTHTDELSPISF